MGKRKNYVGATTAVLGKLPSDANADSMDIETGTFILTVSSASLSPLNTFIDDVVALGQQSKVIKNLIIKSLILNTKNGRYSLSIQADII
jgi:hypothetical protein